MSRLALRAATLALALALPLGAALAAGSGGGSSADDSSPAPSTAEGSLEDAVALIEAGNYSDAIPILLGIVAANSFNPDAYNYLGYSYRKLGDVDNALENYKRALQIEPNHLGANEYLGELYLELGDLEKAEQRLAVIGRVCTDCEEYTELQAQIDAYKAQQG